MWSPGLVNFVPAVTYHFCLNLHEKYWQPGAHFLAHPCTPPRRRPARPWIEKRMGRGRESRSEHRGNSSRVMLPQRHDFARMFCKTDSWPRIGFITDYVLDSLIQKECHPIWMSYLSCCLPKRKLYSLNSFNLAPFLLIYPVHIRLDTSPSEKLTTRERRMAETMQWPSTMRQAGKEWFPPQIF